MIKTLLLGRSAALAFAAFAFALPAAAQDVAITNARLVIGDGSGPVDGGTVVVRGGRVVAAGQGVAVPAGIRVVDAGGKWVSPGIFAGFTRLGIVEIDAVDGTNDVTVPLAKLPPIIAPSRGRFARAAFSTSARMWQTLSRLPLTRNAVTALRQSLDLAAQQA